MPPSQANAALPTAVITGAAGGIGRALALALAKQGRALVLADVDAAALERVQAEAAGYGHPVACLRTDVADASQIEQLCAFSFETLGHVDLLVNNAGVLATGPCWDLETRVYERVLNVNLWSVIHALRAFVPRMSAQGHGHIVNVASMAGLAVGPWLAPYTISKQGVVALTEGLAMEVQASGLPLKVSVVCPGPVATGIAQNLSTEAPGSVSHMNHALRTGIAQGMTADEMAQHILAGVAAGDFWIMPHDEARAAAKARVERIVQGEAPSFAV
ncbi:SDR family NAD(P)-dependent oxidoreductase [Ralstonia soli]|uniref:SDR family NAD(P)-dependent oxidoreductase n=1 Tax=Ralstonia soli TaxID=2953896 RepID=A0ABT1AGV1_9RALS|nr:SDR family NAD(P)-dependent oxidoreductase [Ralstonia soli]MCO5397352.1 SDR family NAD(P)-dependent oxidoreductase [Ralstonia soli]